MLPEFPVSPAPPIHHSMIGSGESIPGLRRNVPHPRTMATYAEVFCSFLFFSA
jgi:hypothetical protein